MYNNVIRFSQEFGEHQKAWGLCCHLYGFRLLIVCVDRKARIPFLELGSERAVEDARAALKQEMCAAF